jgi:hypothetical protein
MPQFDSRPAAADRRNPPLEIGHDVGLGGELTGFELQIN